MSKKDEVQLLIKMDKETYGFIRNLDNLEEKEGIFPSIAAFNTFVEAVRDGKIIEVKGDLIDRSELEKVADEYIDEIMSHRSRLVNYVSTYDVYRIINSVKAAVKFDEEEKEWVI